MKHEYPKQLALTLLCFCLSYCLQAQYSQQLTVNNVGATIGVGGNLFNVIIDSLNYHEPQNIYRGFEAPKGSGIKPLFTSTLWLSAFDDGNNLRSALQRDKLHGGDYADGPIASSYDAAYDHYYKGVFKVTAQQITQHINLTFPVPMQSVDTNLLKWPGKGNTWVQSTYGVTISDNLAHFVDVNSNGIYDPWNGDFPALCGDEGVFFVVNDVRHAHYESGTTPLGVEIRGLVEANYDPSHSFTKGPINNTIFVKYEIENKSGGMLHDFYIGEFQDPDLGCFANDRIGCDTSRNLLYAYNDSYDVDCYDQKGYGTYKAAVGTCLLNYGLSAFGYFTDGAPASQVEPSTAATLRNSLQGKWVDGTSFTEGGTGYGGSTVTKFLFSGNPLDNTTWSDENSTIAPGDRRIYGAIGPLQVASGASVVLDMAYFFSYDSTATNLSIIDTLKRDADSIQEFYNSVFKPCHTANTILSNPSPELRTQLFPNPSDGYFTIKSDEIITNLQLYDLSGHVVLEWEPGTSITTINLRGLAKGIYMLKVSTASGATCKKLVFH